ncbi:TetM/TetW/TetO/TetS family tetracycline resistance ribosomal protection protein [Clostridiaceae bacterium M8S5]|nr:TetM/TetW/TetO/TetS family tetracycline resistance ribosomal protection protein [Clostridiaceae bacterium M8S5]
MIKTIGVLAHVDAGKTTFCEQLLYHTDKIKSRGRVDHKNSFMDTHYIEKNRGITVFSDQAVINYSGCKYYLIDTPGHVDFSPEMNRAIKMMDYAIVILSAVEGLQGHTETIYEFLRKNNIPTFFFINKIDRIGARVEEVMEEIKDNLFEDVYYIEKNLKHENMLSEELIEFMAERDEKLLEKYLDGERSYKYWIEALKHMIKENNISICMRGSALLDDGVVDFFDNVDLLTHVKNDIESGFGGRVYKIRHDKDGARLTHIKITTGKLKVRDEVNYIAGEEEIKEKVTQLREYNADKYEKVNDLNAGDMACVLGLTKANVGDGLGELLGTKDNYESMTALKAKVIFKSDTRPKEALKYFMILDLEEPSLKVSWQEKLEEIHVHVMGVIQLEVLADIIKDRFSLDVEFAKPEIIYKETIKTKTIGYGHFEPLRHYAEVHLKIEPNESGEGIIFENQCHVDMLPIGNQKLVEKHIFEKDHNGLLTGSELTDLKITLLTGRASKLHTSGGDFRQATYRALRQGLEKAENILLEPYYDFKIQVKNEHIGRVISDIQKYHGSFNEPENLGDNVIITGKGPVATFMNYSMELTTFTKGKGKLSFKLAGYEACHNQDEVIAKIGYDKTADSEYISSSIFCSKGKSYTLKWDECEKEMHCLR